MPKISTSKLYAVLNTEAPLIGLDIPKTLASALEPFFALTPLAPQAAEHRISIRHRLGRFKLDLDGETIFSGLPLVDIVPAVSQASQLALIDHPSRAFLSAGLVSYKNRGILVLGDEPALRDYLTAWLLTSGFNHGAQSLIELDGKGKKARPIALPLSIDGKALVDGQRWHALLDRPSLLGSFAVHAAPPESFDHSSIDLIVLVRRGSGEQLTLTVPTKEMLLASAKRTGSDAALSALSELVDLIPAICVNGGRPEHFDGVLDTMLKAVLDYELTPAELIRFQSAFVSASNLAKPAQPIPERSTRQLQAKLTIGMATYDDYDGVYFSIQAIRLYHPEILDQVEFVIIDNNPTGLAARHLKDLENLVPNLRYIPEQNRQGTAVRDLVFQEAVGEYVLCMDSHVLFPSGALAALLAYFDAHPDTRDLLQGPMLWENLKGLSSHWEENWLRGMFGTWALNPNATDPNNEPFDIPMQGLGMFACRRDAWLGFNERFKGFGGEEGYIHAKFRQNGARALCLPALKWVHRFARPRGVPYAINWHDRFHNYLLGRQELKMEAGDVVTHMRSYLGQQATTKLLNAYAQQGEIALDQIEASA